MSLFSRARKRPFNHFHRIDILIVFLITIPLVSVSGIGIRSIHTENMLAKKQQLEKNAWLAKTLELNIKQYVDNQISPFIDWLVQHSTEFEEMRMWTFNRIELDLVTVFKANGERVFPESNQSAMVAEVSLLNQIQGELTTVIKNSDEVRLFKSFIQTDSDSKLLHCSVRNTLIICVLINRNGWMPWLNEALKHIELPSSQEVVLKLFNANGQVLGDSATFENNATFEDSLVFEQAMSGYFSNWHVQIYDKANIRSLKIPFSYLMFVLPLFLLVFSCGIGLFWIYKTRSRQTQAQRVFTAELAHEVRTPLANIRLYVDLIKRIASDKQSRYCSVVESEIERLALLVENSILLARLDSNQYQETIDHMRDINPDQLIERIINTMSPVFEENNCKITLMLKAEKEVNLDKDALQRVMINLLDNARKYARGKHIQVHSFIEDEQLKIDIKDDGPGLSKHMWQKIQTSEFSLVPGNGSGFGLGLKVCQRLCQRMNGKIERIPTPAGTHLRVSIPINNV